ncbi:MAG TPA: S-layer homology domain-containing protein [Vicinamibacterales bacterium]|nr:S-layer homology domain-containing protein [Vicinamibacterales bacterium]
MRAPSGVVALALVLATASCAKKPATTSPSVPGAPRFSEFVFPSGPATLAPQPTWDRYTVAWDLLQAGDTKAADREFNAIVKESPGFYPAETALGYSALARKDAQAAAGYFDRALATAASYAPALAGRGEALLLLGRNDAALAAFEAALAADATLTSVRSRVDVLKFRGAQQNIEAARKAADAGKLDEARRRYADVIASSPQSGFLYRELAAVEQKAGDAAAALGHAERAVALDSADARALLLIAEIHEANKEWAKAADAYTALNAIEPTDATATRIDQMREQAAFEAMPAEYRSIDQSPAVTRAQLAALLGVRLEDLLRRARSANAAVITDVRGNWAAPWILAVARADVMDAFPNHTFQPAGPVRRGDLAQAISRVLTLIAAEKPRLAVRWRDPRPKFSDLAPNHLAYSAAARAVSSGVLSPLEGDTFQLSRPVTGAEAADAVSKLAALAKK